MQGSAAGRSAEELDERPRASREDVVDAVLSASRALVAIAARSLGSAADEVTLPQYRLLVVLASRGPQRGVDLAEEFDVHPSTVGRMCDRLVRKGLVRRDRGERDRRSVVLGLSDAGRALIDGVTERRRAEILRLVRRLGPDERRAVVSALQVVARAAGETPEREWATGWRL